MYNLHNPHNTGHIENHKEHTAVTVNFTLLFRSRLKGMPQKDLINIRNYDVRHLIPKVCSAVLKNGAEILIGSTVK